MTLRRFFRERFPLIREIRDGAGALVFRRWELLRTRWGSIFLHGMYEPEGDKDEHCHDHPWSFVSLVLWGGYFEVSHDTKTFTHRVWRPGSIRFQRAQGAFHRILALNGPKSFSLVLAATSRRLWGYWTQEGWIDNVSYRNRKHEGTLPCHGYSMHYLNQLRLKREAAVGLAAVK
jgi:hypothetical protein